MSDIYVTLYTKEHVKMELTEVEWNFFDRSIVTLHRDGGPAIIYYYRDGTISHEHYYINGKFHRPDGPACIYYNRDGTISYGYYWINGKGHSKEGYWKEITILNNRSNILKMVE